MGGKQVFSERKSNNSWKKQSILKETHKIESSAGWTVQRREADRISSGNDVTGKFQICLTIKRKHHDGYYDDDDHSPSPSKGETENKKVRRSRSPVTMPSVNDSPKLEETEESLTLPLKQKGKNKSKTSSKTKHVKSTTVSRPKSVSSRKVKIPSPPANEVKQEETSPLHNNNGNSRRRPLPTKILIRRPHINNFPMSVGGQHCFDSIPVLSTDDLKQAVGKYYKDEANVAAAQRKQLKKDLESEDESEYSLEEVCKLWEHFDLVKKAEEERKLEEETVQYFDENCKMEMIKSENSSPRPGKNKKEIRKINKSNDSNHAKKFIHAKDINGKSSKKPTKPSRKSSKLSRKRKKIVPLSVDDDDDSMDLTYINVSDYSDSDDDIGTYNRRQKIKTWARRSDKLPVVIILD